MLNSLLKRICLSVVGLALLGPAAWADSFTLTGVNPSGMHLGGVYTGPYVATINGITGIQVICDDFQTNTHIGEELYVTETKVSELNGTDANQVVKFNNDDADQQRTNYMTGAFLALQMIAVDQSTYTGRMQAALLNYSIWGLFYEQAFDRLTTSQQTTAQQYLADAQNAVASQTVDMYSQVSIWTPNPYSAGQEFISVSVPESSMVGLLAFHGLVLLVLGRFLRQRGVKFAE